MKVKRFGLLLTTLVAFLIFNQSISVETQPTDIRIAFDPPIGTPDTSFTATVKNFSWNDMANVALIAHNQFTGETVEITLPDENLNIGPRRRATVSLPSLQPGLWSLRAEGSWTTGGNILTEGAIAVGTSGSTVGEILLNQTTTGKIIPAFSGELKDVGLSVWTIQGQNTTPIIALNWLTEERVASADDIYLVDSAGNFLADPENGSLIFDVFLDEGEFYYLFVFGSSEADYELTTAEWGSDNEPTAINVNTTVIGSITSFDDEDIFTFSANIGQTLEAWMLTDERSSFDPEIEIYDLNGNLLATNDDYEGPSARLLFTAPATGQYQIKAQSHNNSSEGAYQLRLQEYFAISPEIRLVYGNFEQGLTPPNNGQAWQFEGQRGEVITIEVLAIDVGFDPSLALYGPDGTESGRDDDGGGDLNALLRISVPETGVYTIIVTGYGGTSGRYWVRANNE